jgi:tartrate-resistant acid phosphatase type 5
MAMLGDFRSPHFEPFIHLAEVDDDQALIAWGGFWFVPFQDRDGLRMVDDEELERVDPGRNESIGARSTPYGHAVVEAFDPEGRLAARAETREANHVWLRDLQADTEYRYRITVDGKEWAAGERKSWRRRSAQRGELWPSGRSYDLRFRTLPDPNSDRGVTFCAMGDYGIGVQMSDGSGERQLRIAEALERAIEHHDVRLILTLGDNIYHLEGKSVGGSGHEDDDWYFSYYEPYRWLLAQIPVYPAVGNHDAGDTENSDDRGQLSDNHYIEHRFLPEVEAGRASVEPGLFYCLDYSRRVQFISLDTSEARELPLQRYFQHEHHGRFIDDALSSGGHDRACFRIPFCHHPPFCAGPKHHNDPEIIEHLVPRFQAFGVELVLSGHEHNFQYSKVDGVHYVVSGAGGKLREERPSGEGFTAAHTRAWSAAPHFLMVRIDGAECEVWALADITGDGGLRCIDAEAPDGTAFEFPIRITARERASSS